MEYERNSYFRDSADDDVKGFVVIDTSERHGYRIAEARDGEWVKPYWMSEMELKERVSQQVAEYYTHIDDNQMERVLALSGVSQ